MQIDAALQLFNDERGWFRHGLRKFNVNVWQFLYILSDIRHCFDLRNILTSNTATKKKISVQTK